MVTQSFRLIGKTDIQEITTENFNGQRVIYWEDIELLFPGVRYVKNGNVLVSMMRDSDGIRIARHRIKHCPGVVLDVVLSSMIAHAHVDSDAPTELNPPLQQSYVLGTGANVPSKDIQVGWMPRMPDDDQTRFVPERTPCGPGTIVDMLGINSLLSSSAKKSEASPIVTLAMPASGPVIAAELSADLSPTEPRHMDMTGSTTTHIQSQLKLFGEPLSSEALSPVINSKSAPTTTDKPGFENTVISKLNVLHDQDEITQRFALRVLELQKQMNDRSILIESKTAAILTRNYELREFTIPRLFIVLPETSTSWDPATMSCTKFRLHFVCECGDYRKAFGGKISHHVNLANHEGYAIKNPTEFFEKYAPFLMLMLEMIKPGTITGHVVPALGNLKTVDVLDSVKSTVDSVTSKVAKGVDYSLAYLEESRAQIQKSDGVDIDSDAKALQHDLGSYLAEVEGLEGGDLRQLGSHLSANSSDNLLGNMYRTTTKDGHVKWVCQDHYRAAYQEAHTQKLRNVVKLAGGKFDEQLGRVEITLKSRFGAAMFYDAISQANGVLDLMVTLFWNQEYTDFVKLKDVISKSNVRSLTVRLKYKTGPNSDINNGARRYDPIFEIMRLPSIQAFAIRQVPKDFFLGYGPIPGKSSLYNLKYLRVDTPNSKEFSDSDLLKLKSLIVRAPNLSLLELETGWERVPAVFTSIAEHQTYPVNFRKLSLRFLPPRGDSRPSKTALRDMTQVFKVHGAELETLDLCKVPLDDSAVEALAEALWSGSSLRELKCASKKLERLSDKGIKNLASIVAHSQLRSLHIEFGGGDGHVALLESIQWKNIRQLDIIEFENNQEKAMRALLDGMEKIPGKVELEKFHYHTEYTTPAVQAMVRRVISLLLIKHLDIWMELTSNQTLALLESVDVSRLEGLYLLCSGWKSSDVQIILDALQHATQLRHIWMICADITQHKEQMDAKGIKLES